MRHVDALSRVSCLMLEDSLQYRLQQAQFLDPWYWKKTNIKITT